MTQKQPSVEEIVEEHFPLEFFVTENCPVKAGEMFGDIYYAKWSDEQTKIALLKQDKVRKTLQAERQKQEEMVEETEKAFGGCKKCYGKGYSTVTDSTTYHADFIGDKTYSVPNNPMRFCDCERGKQLQKYTNQIRKEAVEEEKGRIWHRICELADDYTGDLETHLDEIDKIIRLTNPNNTKED